MDCKRPIVSVACIERCAGEQIVIGDEVIIIEVVRSNSSRKLLLKVTAPPGVPIARRESFERAKLAKGRTDATETRTN
jgi:sRNA-binding carbon storage regulator CsrA